MSTNAPMDTTSWVTNSTPSAIAAALRAASRVLVFTHMKPDGDAVGSSLALVRTLGMMPGKRAEAVYGGPQPGWMGTVAGTTPTRRWEKSGPPREEPDAIVVIDTGSWSQLEIFKSYLEPRSAKTIVIDHHRRGDAAVSAKRWIDTGAAAVCQQAAGLCCLLLGVMPAQLPVEVASMLYLGLATDTGWFRHSNVSSDVMSLAADLLATGVDANGLYQAVEQQDSPGRLRLMARALASLELSPVGGETERAGIMTLTRADFAAAGASGNDSGGLIDMPMTLATVRVAALLTEADPADYGGDAAPGVKLTKLSLRSKTDAIDVDKVCRLFGGGGHIRAAGAKVPLELSEAKRRLMEALANHRPD
jgi:phosphoesterase RecJ-like protein